MDPWVVISSSPATTTRDHDQDQHNNSNSAEDTLNDNYIERTSRPNNNSGWSFYLKSFSLVCSKCVEVKG